MQVIVIIRTNFKRGTIKMPSENISDGILFGKGSHVRRRQLLHKFTAAFAPPKRRKLYQLLRKFIPV